MRILPFLVAIALLSPHPQAQADLRVIEPGDRVVFLGDSITQGGAYIAFLQAYLWHQFPDRDYELVNLGLSSETASGMSEKTHPFPRPCIHTRLDRALAESKPDVTFLCYGMNDGIYHPINDEQQRLYQEGMTKLIEKVKATGSKVILMTPPPFDADQARLQGKELAPAGMDDYSYRVPYEGYNDVLIAFSDWVKAQEGKVDLVIDLNGPLMAYIQAERAKNPKFNSGDSIHPSKAGHFVMARTILEGLEAPGSDTLPDLSTLTPESDHPLGQVMPQVMKRHGQLSSSWREHVGHDKPGKAKALPLEEGVARAKAIEAEIRATLKK